MNLVVMSANLVADPEVKEVNGTSVANVRLAHNRKYTAKDGSKQEDTLYINGAIWGGLATTAGQILYKGDKVTIKGRLEQQSWEKDGEKKSTYSIRIDEFDKHYGRATEKSESTASAASAVTVPADDNGEQIPF